MIEIYLNFIAAFIAFIFLCSFLTEKVKLGHMSPYSSSVFFE